MPLFTWICACSYNGSPLVREPLQGLPPVAVPQLRACVAPPGSFGEDVDRRVEPDRDCARVQQLARPRIDIGAAASGDDPHRPFLDEPGHEAALAIAEILFAIALENLGGG